MLYQARPPQRLITGWVLDHPRSNVWAPMGFGKTGAVLDALDILERVEDGPVLVVGPLRVAEVTWPDELAKWDHLSRWTVSPILGTPAQRLAAMRRRAMLYTVNFENVQWLVAQHQGRRWPYPTVVFDEATRLQGFRLKQGSAQAGALSKVAHQSRRWINLTGTPAPNGLLGLWGQHWFVDQGRSLGRTFSAYRERWFQATHERITLASGQPYLRPVTKPLEYAQEEIEARMRPTTLSFRVRDWYPDLKEPIRNVVPVRLPATARRHYREMERELFTQIRGHEIEAVHAAAKSLKCLQLASGGAYDDQRAWHQVHDAKIEALRSVIFEAAGANVLVVYQWRPTLERLLKAFRRGRHIKDADSIRAWQRGEIELGFVHPKSVGHGQSLQDGGNVICHFDQWWDLEAFDQINERLGAMRQLQSGYDRDVFEHYLVAEDTLDQQVLLRHETKRSVQDLLMDAMQRRGP